MSQKKDFLKDTIKHIDIKEHNVVPLVDSMAHMAFSARDLNRASKIFEMMVKDENCAVILTLAGSIFSAVKEWIRRRVKISGNCNRRLCR